MPNSPEQAYEDWVKATRKVEAAQAALDAHPFTQRRAQLEAELQTLNADAANDESHCMLRDNVNTAKLAAENCENAFKASIVDAADHAAVAKIIYRPSVTINDEAAAIQFLMPLNPNAIGIKLGEAKKVLLACRAGLEAAQWVVYDDAREVQIKKEFRP